MILMIAGAQPFLRPPQDPMPSDLTLPQKTRNPRKGTIYTPEERAVLAQYKQEYCSTPTREERHALLRTKILVDIFNYWSGNGVIFTPAETHSRMKVCIELSLYIKSED